MEARDIALIITTLTALAAVIFPMFKEMYMSKRDKKEKHKEDAINAIIFVLENVSQSRLNFSSRKAQIDRVKKYPKDLELSVKIIEQYPKIEGFDGKLLILEAIFIRYGISDIGFISKVHSLQIMPAYYYDENKTLVSINEEKAANLYFNLKETALSLIKSVETALG